MMKAQEKPETEEQEATVSLMETASEPGSEPGASSKAAHERSVSTAITVAVCLTYTVVGPMLILLNKYLMARGHFPYPILLTCFGQVSSCLVSTILVRGFKVVPLTKMSWSFYVQNVMAVGLATGGAMATGNSTYMYLSVAFIEILKGFTPVVTIMVQAFAGQSFPRPVAGFAVLMISVGTTISSLGEINLNIVGLLLMLGSIYSEALRLMLTQRLLQDMRFHVLEGLYFLSPATLVWLMPLALMTDVRQMQWQARTSSRAAPHLRARVAHTRPLDLPRPPRLPASQEVRDSLPETWHLFVLAAVIGFLVNTSSFLVIKRTNVSAAHCALCCVAPPAAALLFFPWQRLCGGTTLAQAVLASVGTTRPPPCTTGGDAQAPRHRTQRARRRLGHRHLWRPRYADAVRRLRRHSLLLRLLQLCPVQSRHVCKSGLVREVAVAHTAATDRALAARTRIRTARRDEIADAQLTAWSRVCARIFNSIPYQCSYSTRLSVCD